MGKIGHLSHARQLPVELLARYLGQDKHRMGIDCMGTGMKMVNPRIDIRHSAGK